MKKAAGRGAKKRRMLTGAFFINEDDELREIESKTIKVLLVQSHLHHQQVQVRLVLRS